MPSTSGTSDDPPRRAGHFSDGRSAARHPVTLHLEGDVLRLVGADQATLATWPLQGLRFIDEPRPGQPVRFTSEGDADARLTVSDGDTIQWLRRAAPDPVSRPRVQRAVLVRGLGYSALAVAVAAALYLAFPYVIGRLAALVPLEWEEAVGEATIEHLVSAMQRGEETPRFCAGAAGTAVLDRATARLAAAADSPYRFSVKVADVDVTNAFAAPGGHIVLLGGLIDAAETPDEVVGVLAHEMGHVIGRHATRAILRQLGFEMALTALFGDPSSAFLGQAATVFLHLSYSREAEAEADAMALEMLRASGIRADGLAAFFARLARDHGEASAVMGFLSTHPPSEVRAQAARATAGLGGDAMTAAEWVVLKGICEGA